MTDPTIIEAGAKAIWDARRAREGGNITWEQANSGKDEFPNTYIVVENTRQEAAACLVAASSASPGQPGAEEYARIADDFASSRPLIAPQPSERVIGRYEGEQAASAEIARRIRAHPSPQKRTGGPDNG